MEKLRRFFREVKTEAKKTHWPNWHELVGSTTVVVFILLTMGVYFFILDLFFSGFMRALLGILGIR